MTTDAISRDPELYERAVERLTLRPSFMAHLLCVVLAGDVSAERIAAELDCAPANAIRLALMRVPRSDPQMFREDVTRIAEAAGVDRTRLLACLRLARSMIAFEADALDGRQPGMLLAARDLLAGPDDQED